MTTTTPITYCPSCDEPDLGTRYCESCGTELVRDEPVIGAGESQSFTPASKPALPLVLLFAGIIGPAIVGATSSLVSLALMSAAYSVRFEVVILLFLSLAPVAVVLAGRTGQASTGARIGGLLVAAIGPAIELIVVVMDSRMAFSLGAVGAVEQLLFLIGPVLITVAWLMSTGSPASTYRVLWIAAAVAIAYGLIVYLLPVAGNVELVWRSIVANLVRAGGLLAALLLIPRYSRIRTASSDQRPSEAADRARSGAGRAAYAFIPQTHSTNGFAVSALVFGLFGGAVLPIVFGHIALAQIRRTGDRGRGMAIAGLVLGYLSLAVVIVIAIVVLVSVANSRGSY
jgi:hypothetical protein